MLWITLLAKKTFIPQISFRSTVSVFFVLGCRVTSFDLLRENFPSNGYGDFIDDYSDGEDVDTLFPVFPVFPIGTVHGKSPTFARLRGFMQNESSK